MTASAIEIRSSVRLCATEGIKLGPRDEEGPRRFSMVAYTGALVDVGWGLPVAFDLAGIDFGNGRRPIFRQHDANRLVGQTERVWLEASRALKAEGFFLEGKAFKASEEVLAAADSGFEWQASVQLNLPVGEEGDAIDFVEDDEEIEMNGRTFKGPMLAARRTILKEISFVPLGADSATSAVALADSPTITLQKGKRMPEETKERGATPAEIRAAFPDDAGFALEAICEGWSLADARNEANRRKAAKADKLERELADAKAKLEAAEQKAAKLEAAGDEGIRTFGGVEKGGDTEDDPVSRFRSLFEAQIEQGKPRAAAMSLVIRRHPKLHEAYLESFNDRFQAAKKNGADYRKAIQIARGEG